MKKSQETDALTTPGGRLDDIASGPPSGRFVLIPSAASTEVVPFAPPFIGREEMDEVLATLQSGWLATGARVREFERAFAAYVSAPHAVAVNSRTAGLHLSLLSASGAGDEVVTTPCSAMATVDPYRLCRASGS